MLRLLRALPSRVAPLRVVAPRLLHNFVVDGENLTADLPPIKTHLVDGVPTSTKTNKTELLEYYRTLLLMRRVEIVSDLLYKSQVIRGFCHLYDGQEAICVGMEAAITKDDSIITAYRDHCTQIGRGDTAERVLAELCGRFTGCSKGKGGSMHMYLRSANFFGGNGIVGAQIPVGTGLAFAHKYNTNGGNSTPGSPSSQVAISMFGDGASNQGQLFEAMNMAQLWKLPIIYVLENNQYGMGTSKGRAASNPDFYQRYDNIPGIKTDGMDVHAVRDIMSFAANWCRTGNGPILVECDTYRYHGHSMSDPGLTYRSRDEVSDVRKSRDPIDKLKRVILDAGFAAAEDLKVMEKEARVQVDKAVEFAKNSAEPPLDQLYADVMVPNPNVVNGSYVRGAEVNSGIGSMMG
mmetsp:Transcript_12102/g.27936  ORF Transcript_12102/g.27936 Transcript_12102/m.27936 type:complete len:406 (+) Transcript_12102:11-1228(+)